jgi:hypothetical protein
MKKILFFILLIFPRSIIGQELQNKNFNTTFLDYLRVKHWFIIDSDDWYIVKFDSISIKTSNFHEKFGEISSYNENISKIKIKKQKNPHAPKKPKSSYFFFCDEHRSKLIEKHKKKNKGKQDKTMMGKVAKELGELWKKVSDKDKNKYNKLANKDKERYESEMNSFNEKFG